MHTLFEKSYKGIQGIELIDSGHKGPIIGISACTHGGEVVGLEIIDHLKELGILQSIKIGKIFLILNNLKAYEKYIKILSQQKSISSRDLLSTRFIDENMNRCCSDENLKTSNSYEVQRVQELLPVIEKLDVIFDIHSTYSPSDSMAILTHKSYERYSDILNVEKELVGITEVQVGKPFIDLVERIGGIGIGIESGCQGDNSGYKIGFDNILRLLQHLQMIEKTSCMNQYLLPILNKQVLKISGSIVVKNGNFHFFKNYNHGDQIKKGEKICYDGEKNIYANQDALIIMPSKNSSNFEKLTGEEGCFLGTIDEERAL